jgi:DNA/RNA-binding domain of Phe-tRNA-synthetase-like protein
VEPDAAALGLANASAVLIDSDEPFGSAGLSEEELAAAVAMSSLGPPEEDGYFHVLSALGYSGVEPAGRRLVRVAAERGLRSYGLLVDACNVVALRHAAGIGLHDLGGHADQYRELVVFRARGGEKIVPAFRDSVKSIPVGDLVYGFHTADGFEPLAWLGKRDTDSAAGQIRESTMSAVVVVLGHGDVTAADTATMCAEVTDLVRRHRSGVRVTPLQQAHPQG